jgi:glycosyltransferase involved in cell wall biosynthesis
VPEYAYEDCAFFYDQNDWQELQHALQCALNCNDLKKMADAAMARSKDFDWVDIGAKLATVYRELVPLEVKMMT